MTQPQDFTVATDLAADDMLYGARGTGAGSERQFAPSLMMVQPAPTLSTIATLAPKFPPWPFLVAVGATNLTAQREVAHLCQWRKNFVPSKFTVRVTSGTAGTATVTLYRVTSSFDIGARFSRHAFSTASNGAQTFNLSAAFSVGEWFWLLTHSEVDAAFRTMAFSAPNNVIGVQAANDEGVLSYVKDSVAVANAGPATPSGFSPLNWSGIVPAVMFHT